jgi:hypothetical protein
MPTPAVILGPFREFIYGILTWPYRMKGKTAEALEAFKKIYLKIVDEVIDHLKSQEAGDSSARSY